MSARMSAAQKLSTKLNVPAGGGKAEPVRVCRPSAPLADSVPLDSGGTNASESVWTESPPWMADPSAEAKRSLRRTGLISKRSRLTKLIWAPVSTRTRRVRVAPFGAETRRSRASWRLFPARFT